MCASRQWTHQIHSVLSGVDGLACFLAGAVRSLLYIAGCALGSLLQILARTLCLWYDLLHLCEEDPTPGS